MEITRSNNLKSLNLICLYKVYYKIRNDYISVLRDIDLRHLSLWDKDRV